METVNASRFKTHFGVILTRASKGVVRITRRGMNASVLMPEAEYRELKRKAARPAAEVILTRNGTDFRNSPVPCRTPEAFLAEAQDDGP